VNLEYPQFHSSIPGMGNSSVVNNAVFFFQQMGLTAVNDLETDLRVVMADTSPTVESGVLLGILFDECTPLSANMCNRNQNVTDCCNDPSDPNQFGNFCAQGSCTTGGALCANDAACGANGPCVKSTCNVDGDCTGFGLCVFKCPANPPVCPAGSFPTGGAVGPCTTVAGACPNDNACITQTANTTCTISDPVDALGQPVDGVTCTVDIL
jgi:hypothetical protein